MDWNSVGSSYGNFVVKRSEPIEELQCRLVELEHKGSGARVMHLANDDSENLFCLSFQTIPKDSTGVAHILEHTVLCGSKKFSIKDPFFAMTRRSLNTFMNAMTGSDFTCYPASTLVKKDFYNLLDVYLDAVFFPNLQEISFQQEGHRLEFAKADDSTSGLEYRGVVFNEMKGVLASPSSRLYDYLYNALFPDITYGLNSGGAPEEIPNLTYDELIAFHKEYYHPSRCLFFFYGNMPLEEHLDFIEERVLKGAKKLPPLPELERQKRFSHPTRRQERYPVAESDLADAKAYIAFGWLTCRLQDQEELLALAILEAALMDTDASPLKMALLRSGLCTQANAVIDPDISEVPIGVILKGCDPADGDALETVIRNKLEELVAEGVPDELIDSAMHQVEFHRSEITGDRAPFGLTLFMRSALLEQHGIDPGNGLKIHSLFESLRKKREADSSYFSHLLKKHFLDNNHFVRLTLVPDSTLEKEEAAAEKKKLQEIESGLTDKEKKKIVDDAKILADYQVEQESADPDILPKVTLADVPKNTVDYPLAEGMNNGTRTFFHDTFTNQIVYADLSWRLPAIAEQEMWEVRLFAILLTQMGAAGKDYTATLEAMQAHTGGIGSALNLIVDAGDCQSLVPAFHLHGKALYRKGEELFQLMRDFASGADFSDQKRVEEVVMKHYTALSSSLSQSAMSYALALAASGQSPSSKVNNAWNGLEYYLRLKDLAENYQSKGVLLSQRLEQLKEKLLELENPHLIITCDGNYYNKLEKEDFYGLTSIEKRPFTPWHNHSPLTPVLSQGRTIASPVAFTGRALVTVPYIHPDSPALSAAANLMDNTSLHLLIREQGGAYGGGSSCHNLAGRFLFYAYRDPNIASTLAAFNSSVKKIASGGFNERELEEAKLEKIQQLDSPAAPGSRGEIAYNWLQEGRGPEVRQRFRDKLLSLTKKEVVAAVEKHLLHHVEQAPTVVFAGKELLEKENALMEEKLAIKAIE